MTGALDLLACYLAVFGLTLATCVSIGVLAAVSSLWIRRRRQRRTYTVGWGDVTGIPASGTMQIMRACRILGCAPDTDMECVRFGRLERS